MSSWTAPDGRSGSERADRAGPGDPPPVASRLDPTKMANQPALRTSNGLVWLIMGGLFAAASLVPFAALAFAGSGRSRGVALTAGAVVIVLYAAMLVIRFAVRPRLPRLRALAACMLTMAGVALVLVWVCLLIEAGPRGP